MITSGVLYVTIHGIPWMLWLFVNNWDMSHLVSDSVSIILHHLYYDLFLHQLGARAHRNAVFGSGSGGIFLSNVRCDGTESAIINCTHDGVGVHRCDHREDAGVTCLGIILERSIT